MVLFFRRSHAPSKSAAWPAALLVCSVGSRVLCAKPLALESVPQRIKAQHYVTSSIPCIHTQSQTQLSAILRDIYNYSYRLSMHCNEYLNRQSEPE